MATVGLLAVLHQDIDCFLNVAVGRRDDQRDNTRQHYPCDTADKTPHQHLLGIGGSAESHLVLSASGILLRLIVVAHGEDAEHYQRYVEHTAAA